MTEKLYYTDAYIKQFESRVLSCEKKGEYFEVELESTAFFPEEGGQTADKGFIDGVSVTDVCEKEGRIFHVVEAPIPVGKIVFCTIDFEERFRKMQLHTAEHILCGIIHKKYGFDNVGFHIGEDCVTFDIDGVLNEEQIFEIQLEANKAVFSNFEVSTFIPNSAELSEIEYRAKLDLTENVRLVRIGDIDVCACCAPHVCHTGEIGLIKILDFMKHRGGTRIFMQSGFGALEDYNNKYRSIKEISFLLSTPQTETAETLKKYISDTEELKRQNKFLSSKIARLYAESIDTESYNNVFYAENLSIEDMREIYNCLKTKIKGLLVILTGEENNLKYLIGSNGIDVGKMAHEINGALSGRGGGRGEMIQGSFLCELREVEGYFHNLK